MAAVARLYAVLAEIGSKAQFLAVLPANGPAGRGLDWARFEKLLPDEGLPRDAVVEVASARALGGGTGVAIRAVRTALAKDAAAFAAWVDPYGALYGPGVARAGVDLRRLLVVRPSHQDVGRAAVKVVGSGAFEVVVIDMASLEDVPPQAQTAQKARRGRRPLPPEVMVRKLALLAEKRGTTVLLLSDSTQPRELPWPVALRLELEQRPHELSVRVAKDRRGRVTTTPTWIPLDEAEDLAPPRTARRNRRRPRGMGAASPTAVPDAQPASTSPVPKYELAAHVAQTSESKNRSKRFVAIAFSQLRIEIARANATDTAGPLAVVIAHPNGSVRDEASLLGNTRIDDVSDEARALGILPGFTVAAARARSQALSVRVVSAAAAERALARVAEMALAFGRSTAFSAEENMVFVDVTGCEHLHARDEDPSGARILASRLQECILELGHAARIAVARGPRMAAAFVRRASSASSKEPVLDTDDEAFARLPIDALPLDADTLDWLAKLGLSTIADLRALPPSELGPRLPSSCARDIMALLRGEDETPIVPYEPPEEPEECAELEYGLETNESLLFVVKGLCERLSARLMGRTRCTTHLELVLRLDRALLSDADSPRVSLPMRLAAPIRTPAELMAVLRAKVESYTLAAPILAVTLRATKLVPYEFHARDLFVPEARAEAELPRLVAELCADLGDARVGMFELENRWIPEQRAPKLVPFSGFPLLERRDARLVTRAIEPVRMLTKPIPYTGPVPRDSFLARNEAQEWWRAPKLPPPGSGHDDLAIFIPELGAVAWVVRDRQTKRMLIRGYIEHA
ncbi:hypothetical protein LZC95_16295 [Pendulispora brunnea]|uniref:UmuC domain-containing protein n=1 Tax=Pendulispora brunnea TaxID=2905690 RepID=A0ABZ2KI92_9BACT